MVDSGTTFSHFPYSVYRILMQLLNNHCQSHKDFCGKLGNAVFEEDTCLDLR